ncbi:NnrS family protein [Vibrio sp.]|uniref:NnrS family protein n=1 Tax=Vibrio sp. TaxID=678 RepID=UPI003AA8509E
MLNIDDPSKVAKTPAIWRLGFRPFFLGGAIIAALYIPLWVLTWLLPAYSLFEDTFWSPILPLWWHPHELLFGFAMAIVSGFLLTAVQNWTNQPSLKNWPLALTFSCWALARLSLLIPTPLPIILPAVFDILFLGIVGSTLWRSIYKVKQWRNIGFPLMIIVALCINILSYYSLYVRDFILAHQIWQSMLWWLSLLITIVGGRVIGFFTAMRLNAIKQPALPWVEYPLLLIMLTLVLQALFELLPSAFIQVLLFIAGVLHLIRASRWMPLKSFREPLLWSLHIAYFTLPISLLMMSWYFNDEFAYRCLLHLFAIGGMAMLCLSMISRVSLGHTGRNIYQGPNMRIAFICLPLAAIFRAIMPIYFPSQTHLWLWFAAVFWFGSFAIFVYYYTKILTRPRVDGRPG